MSVMNITKDNFEELVVKNEKAVLLDFWAPWCGPCRMVSPLIDQIAEEETAFAVGKINVDEEPALAQQFGVMSIPTLAVLKNGNVLYMEAGAKPKALIVDIVKKLI